MKPRLCCAVLSFVLFSFLIGFSPQSAEPMTPDEIVAKALEAKETYGRVSAFPGGTYEIAQFAEQACPISGFSTVKIGKYLVSMDCRDGAPVKWTMVCVNSHYGQGVQIDGPAWISPGGFRYWSEPEAMTLDLDVRYGKFDDPSALMSGKWQSGWVPVANRIPSEVARRDAKVSHPLYWIGFDAPASSGSDKSAAPWFTVLAAAKRLQSDPAASSLDINATTDENGWLLSRRSPDGLQGYRFNHHGLPTGVHFIPNAQDSPEKRKIFEWVNIDGVWLPKSILIEDNIQRARIPLENDPLFAGYPYTRTLTTFSYRHVGADTIASDPASVDASTWLTSMGVSAKIEAAQVSSSELSNGLCLQLGIAENVDPILAINEIHESLSVTLSEEQIFAAIESLSARSKENPAGQANLSHKIEATDN